MGSSSVARFVAKYPEVARGVILEDHGLVRSATPAAGAAPQTPEQRRMTILARNNATEEELVAGCMKNSPKWGRSECEFWAPSKRRHHPGTVQNIPSALPPVGGRRENKAQTIEVMKAFLSGT